MCFGVDDKFEIDFYGESKEQVRQFKYLGTIIRSINKK